MFDLFKKDYKPEFENRCATKIEDKALMTRIRHGADRAKLETNIRKSVCNCLAPYANKDLEVVWKTMAEVRHAMFDATRNVTKYEDNIGKIIAPIPKEDFHNICLRRMVRYGYIKKEIETVGTPICECLTDSVLPLVGKNVPTLVTAIYDAKYSLRDQKTIKKFGEKMALETMGRREIPQENLFSI